MIPRIRPDSIRIKPRKGLGPVGRRILRKRLEKTAELLRFVASSAAPRQSEQAVPRMVP